MIRQLWRESRKRRIIHGRDLHRPSHGHLAFVPWEVLVESHVVLELFDLQCPVTSYYRVVSSEGDCNSEGDRQYNKVQDL